MLCWCRQILECLEKMIYAIFEWAPPPSVTYRAALHCAINRVWHCAPPPPSEHFFGCLTMHKSRERASNRLSLSHSESNVYARLFTAWGDGRGGGAQKDWEFTWNQSDREQQASTFVKSKAHSWNVKWLANSIHLSCAKRPPGQPWKKCSSFAQCLQFEQGQILLNKLEDDKYCKHEK